ncbi:MAG: autotransporter outer membrane beta-barrel domain-containing protein [Deltaproteobacteria bacterium]|jgi:hypothetical protein|nr:autotransporter outer membrane beta-barrel domain-containing protein [Deltaproteobacteria bacterium]
MKKRTVPSLSSALSLALTLALGAGAALAADGGEYQREKAFRDLVLDYQKAALHAPSGGDGGSGVSFVLIPEFNYVSHGDVTGTIEGTRLKMAGGDSKAYSLTFIAARQFTDWLKVSFLYEFSQTKYKGGLLVPDQPELSGRTDITNNAHLVGFVGNFTSRVLGNFEVSLMEAWDIYSGTETMVVDTGAGIAEDERSVGAFDDRVFSFIVWWDRDFPVNDSWKVDPYLGWRSVQVVLKGMNDFSPGGNLKDDSSYTHIVSGGLKLKYSAGLMGFYVRAGVNHRITKDPIPGFSTRAVAPGVVNMGFMSGWDRTVASWGLGFSYVVPETVVIDLSYNGGAGSNIKLHTATAAFVFLF